MPWRSSCTPRAASPRRKPFTARFSRPALRQGHVTFASFHTLAKLNAPLLHNAGLPEMVAHSPDEYMRIAVDLATDLPRLAALRAAMRERTAAAPLMDAPRFARAVEAAYRQMWQAWCARAR